MTLIRIPIPRNRHLPTLSAPVQPIRLYRKLTLFKISSIAAFSAEVMVTPAAPMFSSVRAVLLDPGMGMTCTRRRQEVRRCEYGEGRTLSDMPMMYANANCAGVTPFLAAISF